VSERTYDDGLTPDVLEEIIAAAIHERDFEGVKYALSLSATRSGPRKSTPC
jgi:hypothetical protein